jgi:hypothetical protein
MMIKDQSLHSVYLLLNNVYEITVTFFDARRFYDFLEKNMNVKFQSM